MTTAGNTTRTATPRTRSLIGSGIVAAAAAGVATMTVAAAGHAAGISLDMRGAPLPVVTFGLLTAMFSVVGIVLAVVLANKAGRPRRAFVRTTVALTALSLVPSAIADAGWATKALLLLTHLLAAAIVIPALARLLAR